MFTIKSNKFLIKFLAFFVIVCTFGMIFNSFLKKTEAEAVFSPTATLSYTNSGRTFSPDDFILNMGLSSSFGSVEIETLPEGRLLFDGEEVGEDFRFSVYEASLLSYEPKDNSYAQFQLSGGDKSVSCSLYLCEDSNTAPISDNISLKTAKTVALFDTLPAFDKNNDDMEIKLTKKAEKGTLSFNGTDFSYSPYPSSKGEDSFTYIVSDEYGNYSKEYRVDIEIQNINSSHLYDDMAGKSGYASAVFLSEAGLLRGEKKAGLRLFSPDEEVFFEDLMVLLSDISGASEDFTPCFSTGLASDPETKDYLKPYIKSALSSGIITDFSPNTSLTRKEAYTYTAKILGLPEASRTSTVFPNIHEIDSNALPYYLRLYEKGYITLSDVKNPNSTFTKNDLARLIYKITA